MLLGETTADGRRTGPRHPDYSCTGSWVSQVLWQRSRDTPKTSSAAMRPFPPGPETEPYKNSLFPRSITEFLALRISREPRHIEQTLAKTISQIACSTR